MAVTLFLESCSTSERARSPEAPGRRGEGTPRTYADCAPCSFVPHSLDASFCALHWRGCPARSWSEQVRAARSSMRWPISDWRSFRAWHTGRGQGSSFNSFSLSLSREFYEVGQLSAPGRQPSFFDFAASSTGAAIGGLLMWLVRARVLSYLGIDLGPNRQRRSKSDEAKAGADRLEPIPGSSGVAGASLSLAQGSP